MIAFHTNVLVRLLVRDDLEQFEVASRSLGEAAEAGEQCFVSDAVLCETEWVLTSVYGASRADVLAAFHELSVDERFRLDRPEAIPDVLLAYERGKAELSDYLIGQRARAAGARTTFTFDRALRGQGGFTLLR